MSAATLSLTDYGSAPPVAKPEGNQAAASEKLDFHTDTFTGRFNTGIPIAVPPARGGAAPGLALQYNSANKNGWCGVGWELEMGSIERDTRKGVIISTTGGGRNPSETYSNIMGFTFSFGGKAGRLVSLTTNEYRPQIDTAFLRMVFTNGWWIATDKGGRKYHFGETANARATNNYGAFKWALNRISDPDGNFTLVTYTNDLGQLYLSRIDYNGNTNSPTIATNATVIFDLVSTNRLDIISSVVSGSEVQTRKLLGGIRVLSQGQAVRRYALAYAESASTGRSLLQKVQEYGSDDTTTLPAHTFGYSVQAHSFDSVQHWNVVAQTGTGELPNSTAGQTPATQATQLADMNGDGIPDWVTVGDGPYNYYNVQLGTGSGFGSYQYSWSTVANEGNNTSLVWNLVDSSVLNPDNSSSSTCQLIDINGDGLTDRVLRQYSGGSYNHFQVQTNTGSGFSSVFSFGGVAGSSAAYQAPATISSDGKATLCLLTDMNGDGLPDRVLEDSSQFEVQFNLGSSFRSAVPWTGVASSGGSYPYAPRDRSSPSGGISSVYAELMDMNGDGLPDRALSGGTVWLNDNIGAFSGSANWNYSGSQGAVDVSKGQYTTQFLDMNGDGLPDRVVSSSGSYSVYFNTGRGFKGGSVSWNGVDTTTDGTAGWDGLQAWDGYGSKITFMDMDGDGLVDRVRRNHTGSSSFIEVQLNSGPYPDLLTTVTNGIGGVVNVAYTPSTRYNNTDGTRPRLAFPMQTVSSVTNLDGHGNTSVTTYDYANGFYDTFWREFRGFGMVTETNALGAYTRTWYHQGGGTNGAGLGEYNDALAKAGMPYRVESYGNDNKLYTRTLSKVDQVILNTNGIYFPFVRQTITQEYEGNSGYRATATSYAYNAISNNLAASTGNLLSQTNYGEVTVNVVSNHTFTVSNTVASVYTFYTYAAISGNDDIVNRVASTTVTSDSAGSTILQQTTNTYFSGTGDLQSKSQLICPGTFATTIFTYDNYGNVLTTTDPASIVTTKTYDALATFPVVEITGPLTNRVLYDMRSGAVLATTNTQGLVVANAYDAFFRLTNSATGTTPGGAATLTRKQVFYNLGGLPSNNSSNFVRVLVNDPADASGWHESYSYFDGMGRPVQTRDESEVSGQFRVSNVTYDEVGNVVLEEYPFFASGAAYTKYTGTRTNIYTQYDAVGRAWRVNPVATATFTSSGWWNGSNPSVLNGDTDSPVGAISTAFKDGSNPWAVVVTNALGNPRKSYMDAYGRTIQIVEVNGSSNYTTTLRYDLVGNLTNITDHAGNQISFFFDLRGLRVAMADPDAGFWQWGYDLAGRIKVQTDAKGQQQKFFYSDSAGRLTKREGWSGTSLVYSAPQLLSTTTYQYDSSGGDAVYTVYPGQLFSVTDDEGWTKSSYDARGRVPKTVRYLNKTGKGYTNQLTFDDADRVVSAVYPGGGPTITNLFDSGGHLAEVQQAGGAGTVFWTAGGFNALGQALGGSFGNGVVTTNDYFGVSKRLKQITTKNSTNFQSLAYKFDAVGNIKTVTDGVYAGTNSATIGNIQYDDLNRLLSLTNGTGSFGYSYDPIGNVVTNGEAGSSRYGYSSTRPHAVTNANGMWFTYDPNGNVANKGGMRLVYDVNNRLQAALTLTNGVTFGYDGSGARLWKQTATATNVWIGGNYEEKNGQVLFHIYAGGRLVCTFDKTGTNVFTYYHPDNLTSTALETGTNGAVIQHYEYSAFGRTRAASGNAFPVSRRYTSQVLDEETGLYYYNFRYYIPEIARFAQPDDVLPDLTNPQSLNRYAYCVNNPLRFTDPTGHEPGDLFTDQPMMTADDAVAMSKHAAPMMVGVAVAVATGGAAAPVFEAWGAGSLLTAAGSSGVGGFYGNLAAQGTQVAMGDRNGVSLQEAGQAGAISAVAGFAIQGSVNVVSKVTSRIAPETATETTTLYRGVNDSHAAYADAQAGTVKPNGGTATPLEHNTVPGATLNSPYTSWTTDPAVAENFALRPTGKGVVITADVPASKITPSPNLKSVKLMQNNQVVSESEKLVSGTVQGNAQTVTKQ